MRDRNPSAGLMTVGELSRRAGVSVKALRQYTDWGLVYTAGRSASNYRLFTTDALWCLQQIRLLRSLGLTVAEIRELCAARHEAPLGPLLADRLRRARTRLDTQIADLQHKRRRIDEFEAQHQAMLTQQVDSDLWADNPQATSYAA